MAVVANAVIETEGSISGALNVALKHFAYVAHRWDSAATPTRDLLQLITFVSCFVKCFQSAFLKCAVDVF